MSTLKISWVGEKPNEWGEGTNKTYYYQVAGEFEGQSKQTSIGVKDPARKPVVGQEIEGHFETVNGKEKFKKDAPGQSGGFGGSKAWTRPKDDSPASDYPYLALKAAVEFGSAKVGAKHDITGEQIVTMAQIFEKYLRGEAKLKEATPPSRTIFPDEMPDIDDQQFPEGE